MDHMEVEGEEMLVCLCCVRRAWPAAMLATSWPGTLSPLCLSRRSGSSPRLAFLPVEDDEMPILVDENQVS